MITIIPCPISSEIEYPLILFCLHCLLVCSERGRSGKYRISAHLTPNILQPYFMDLTPLSSLPYLEKCWFIHPSIWDFRHTNIKSHVKLIVDHLYYPQKNPIPHRYYLLEFRAFHEEFNSIYALNTKLNEWMWAIHNWRLYFVKSVDEWKKNELTFTHAYSSQHSKFISIACEMYTILRKKSY